MKVLIIGGNRFVGYLLTWRLLAAGEEVTLLNRGSLPDPFGERVERLRLDRTTPAFAEALRERTFDAVVDFAAFTGSDAREAVSVLRRCGHYVFISTGQVYLVRQDVVLPAREEDYDGPVRPRPTDPDEVPGWEYGIGKRDAEDILTAARREYDFPVTVLRLPIVNGERDYLRRIEGYLWRILDGGPVVLPDGGQVQCRHVYGADAALAIADLLGKAETHGRAYNLCQEEQPTLAELLSLLAAMLGAPDRTVSLPGGMVREAGLNLRDVSPFSSRWMSRLDPSRAVRELGFRHTPLETYLGRIVASFLAHPPADRPEGYERRSEEIALARQVATRRAL